MIQKSIPFFIVIALLLLTSACSPTHTPAASNETETILNRTPVPTNPSPTTPLPTPTIRLSPSARLGATLTGSGIVDRNLLTYYDLMAGSATAPVDDSAFALPDEAANPSVIFEGRLKFSSSSNYGSYKVIRDDQNYAVDPARFQLPEFDLQFLQDDSYLIPVTQGLVFSGNPYWNYIIGPGRIWLETRDRGFSRASFPFALVERNQNCVFNGVMAFLFNGTQVSQVRYQVTQETCLYFKFDLWGQVPASYIPETISEAASLKLAHAVEVANRMPTKPISALESDFPDSNVNLAHFSSGIRPEHMTAYGLVINGVNYISDCRTRYGEYAYCESMRLPSYSTAKSAFAAVALMRLGQKYGVGVYDLLIKDYVPEVVSGAGNWSKVTFGNTLDMTTGNYESAGFQEDEYSPAMIAFLDRSESTADKIHYAFQFPFREDPGQTWIYHTSDTFLLARAMNNYLVQKEGSGADIFNFVRDEVYIPIKLSQGALTSVRTDNSPSGAPFGGYGLFWTQDDIAKIGLLLNFRNGMVEGNQVLEPGLLAASMQKKPEQRGLNTTGTPAFKYKGSFWAREWTPSTTRGYTCSFWTPFMSGFGGITVVLMPNNSIYYYFSDNNEFSWYDAVNESNKISPMCP
jgi:hypothetical protein